MKSLLAITCLISALIVPSFSLASKTTTSSCTVSAFRAEMNKSYLGVGNDAYNHIKQTKIGQLKCADLNSDGNLDYIFTLLSGGTRGTYLWGALVSDKVSVSGEGSSNYHLEGYKELPFVIIKKVQNSQVEIIYASYAKTDAQCCPSYVGHKLYAHQGTSLVLKKSWLTDN